MSDRPTSVTTIYPLSNDFRVVSQNRQIPNSNKTYRVLKRADIRKQRQPSNQTPANSKTQLAQYATVNTTPSETVSQKYQCVLEEDQAGKCFVAYHKTPEFPLFAVKHRLREENSGTVVLTHHPNVVSIHDVCVQNASVWIVYDCLTVSLAEIQASPVAPFEEYELAAICQEVSKRKFQTRIRTNST